MKWNQPIFMIFDLALDDPSWDYHFSQAQRAHGEWVLVSPIQPYQSYNSNWWSHYQPLSYEITPKTKRQLKRLCEKAASYGLKIMVDVVWNQTSLTVYTDATKYRYHEENIANPDILYPQKILSHLWESSGLPDLKTELQEIREEGRRAVKTYRDAGVQGFRIDSGIWIDGDFFNFVFQNSPKCELHLYEVFVAKYYPYVEWMKERIKNDACKVIFYYFNPYYKMDGTLTDFLDGTISTFRQVYLPSRHLMNSVLDHDLVQYFKKDDLFNLFQYFLYVEFLQDTQYFMYTITTYQNSPNILFQQRTLFNWENYFGSVEPLLQIKKKLSRIPGTFTTFYYPGTDLSTTLPLLVGSRGPYDKMLVNFQSNFSDSVTSIPYDNLFPRQNNNNLTLYGLISKTILGDKEYENGYIYCPENAFTLLEKISPCCPSNVPSEQLSLLISKVFAQSVQSDTFLLYKSRLEELIQSMGDSEGGYLLLDPRLIPERCRTVLENGESDNLLLGLSKPYGELLFLVCPFSKSHLQKLVQLDSWEEVYAHDEIYIFDEDGFIELEWM
jgi:hypothetical protein